MKRYDVLVCGGGPAGVMAAVAAARAGAQVGLVEQYGFLGGMATTALVLPLMTFHATMVEPVITGLPQELIDRLVARGASPGHLPDPIGFCASITPVDPEALKLVHQELCLEAGVDLLLHSFVVGAEREGDRIGRALLATKEGLTPVEATVFVDATGDGDLAARAGVPFEYGRTADRLAQPMTMMFRIHGVDWAPIAQYAEAHPDDFVLGCKPGDLLRLPAPALAGFFRLVRQAKAEGRFPIERDRVLLFATGRPGEAIVNMTRITRADGTTASGLTRGEVEGRIQVEQVIAFLRRYIPGCERIELIQTGTQVGVRESRRFLGRYVLTGHDVVTGARFDDAIARGAYPIDIHSPSGGELQAIKMAPGTSYDIPYRSLLPREIANLLVTGRCLSADHEALASARISATAMAVGQAAGTAAALSIWAGVDPGQLDVTTLQSALAAAGASWGKAQQKGGTA
ncbi:MAG: FAD-dependent oxidoreductase [Bacillota bacterium]